MKKVQKYWTAKMVKLGGTEADIKIMKAGCNEVVEHTKWAKAITQPEMELQVDFNGVDKLMQSVQKHVGEKEITDEEAMMMAFGQMQL